MRGEPHLKLVCYYCQLSGEQSLSFEGFVGVALDLVWAVIFVPFWGKTLAFMGFPDSSVGKESACNAGYTNLIPGLGRYPGEGIGYPLQCSWASLWLSGKESFDPWVGKTPWRRERLPAPVFWPGESHTRFKELDTTERLSLSVSCIHEVVQYC